MTVMFDSLNTNHSRANFGKTLVSDAGAWYTSEAAGAAPSAGQKVYWEIEIVTVASGLLIGAVPQSYVSTSPTVIPGYSGVGVSFQNQATRYLNGVTTAGPTFTFTAGDTLGFAYDVDAEEVWVSKNGAWLYGDPAAGTSPYFHTFSFGVLWPSVTMNGVGAVCIGRFSNTDFNYTVPSGFTPLDNSGEVIWEPLEINPDLWLDASDSSTITIDTGVSEWADKSGNSRDYIQATTTYQPAVVSGGLNSLNTIQFTSDWLDYSGSFSSSSEFHLFVVMESDVDPAAANSTSGCWDFNASGVTYSGTHPYTDGGIYEAFAAVPRRSAGNPTPSLADPHFYSAHSTTPGYEVYVNGTQLYSDTSSNTPGIADGTSIGKSSETAVYYYGQIAEIIVVAGTVDRELVEGYLAWKWGLEALLPTGHTYESAPPTVWAGGNNFHYLLVQPYDLLESLIVNEFEQPYKLLSTIPLAWLQQYYHLQFFVRLTQNYGDVAFINRLLRQYYWDAAYVLRLLRQEYEDGEVLYSILDQYYEGPELIVARLIQLYHIIEGPINTGFSQEYALSEFNLMIRQLRQAYTLDTDSSIRKPSSSVTIGGAAVRTLAVSIEYSLDQYVGSCSLTLATFPQWEAVEDLDPIVVTINAQEYHFVVTDKKKTDTNSGSTFYIEGLSQAVLLDFPYATEITNDELVTGNASVICSAIAALEGQTITWSLPVDPPQTSDSYQIAGDSPLAAIRNLVNELGGKLQSAPDGSLSAVPASTINSNAYDTAAPDFVFSSSLSFTSLSTDHDKRDGFNRFSVSNESTQLSTSLEAEKVTPGHYKIKAPRVPWETTPMTLRTSELTNVTIVPAGATTELIEDELVEIVEGEGQTDHSIYAITDIDYESRVNLGDITFTESGLITTTSQAETLITLSYETRYWQWDVYGTDTEEVQFILEG